MSDFMAVHTLEHLQCIVVMGVFLVSPVRVRIDQVGLSQVLW